MKVLVTGSLGFIATNLIVDCLSRIDIELLGVDSNVSGSSNLKYSKDLCQHRIFDLRDKKLLCDALEGVDAVVHLAAKGSVIDSIDDPISNFESNVVSTLCLLECMKTTGVSRLVFSSTGGALMGNSAPPVDERTPPRPISPYGASKLACEGYISAFCNSYGMKAVSLRFGNVYGPFSLHKKGVINKWLLDAIHGRELSLYGDGLSSRDYIHSGDLCAGILLALNYSLGMGPGSSEVFHLANGIEITLSELASTIARTHGSPSMIKYMPPRPGEVERNFADISHAKSVLNFQPSTTLEVGIKELYLWLRENVIYDNL